MQDYKVDKNTRTTKVHVERVHKHSDEPTDIILACISRNQVEKQAQTLAETQPEETNNPADNTL